jgi:hypothetical protein
LSAPSLTIKLHLAFPMTLNACAVQPLPRVTSQGLTFVTVHYSAT